MLCQICKNPYHATHECPCYRKGGVYGANRIACIACLGIGHLPNTCWVLQIWVNWASAQLNTGVTFEQVSAERNHACFACCTLQSGHRPMDCPMRDLWQNFKKSNKHIQRHVTHGLWTDVLVSSPHLLSWRHRNIVCPATQFDCSMLVGHNVTSGSPPRASAHQPPSQQPPLQRSSDEEKWLASAEGQRYLLLRSGIFYAPMNAEEHKQTSNCVSEVEDGGDQQQQQQKLSAEEEWLTSAEGQRYLLLRNGITNTCFSLLSAEAAALAGAKLQTILLLPSASRRGL